MRKLAKFKARELNPNPCHIRDPEPEADLRALGMSVIRHQELPLIIRPDKVIGDGHRRRAGVMAINPDFELECLVTDEELDPHEIQLITATQKNLRPYEKFKVMAGWLDTHPGETAAKLAERVGMTPGNATMILSLARCLPIWHEKAAAGLVSVSDWYEASRLDDKGQFELLELKLATGASREALKSASRKRRNGERPAVTSGRIRIELAGGIVATFSGKNLSLDNAIEAAGEAGKVMKKGRDDGLTAKTIQRISAEKAKGG